MQWLARLFGFKAVAKKTEIQLLAEQMERRLKKLNEKNG